MDKSNLNLILVNDSHLYDSTIDVLQEHFLPDFGINCGFLQSFDGANNSTKLEEATKECFDILRQTNTWAFVEEIVEVNYASNASKNNDTLFVNLKQILLTVQFGCTTTMLIHGSAADTSMALSILTDEELSTMYKIKLNNYSTQYRKDKVKFSRDNTIKHLLTV